MKRPASAPAPATEPDWKRYAERLFDTSSRQEYALGYARALAWALQQALNSDDPEAEGVAIVLADCLADAIREGLKPADREEPHAAA